MAALPSKNVLRAFNWRYRTDKDYRNFVNLHGRDELYSLKEYREGFIKHLGTDYQNLVNEAPFNLSALNDDSSKNLVNFLTKIETALSDKLDEAPLPITPNQLIEQINRRELSDAQTRLPTPIGSGKKDSLDEQGRSKDGDKDEEGKKIAKKPPIYPRAPKESSQVANASQEKTFAKDRLRFQGQNKSQPMTEGSLALDPRLQTLTNPTVPINLQDYRERKISASQKTPLNTQEASKQNLGFKMQQAAFFQNLSRARGSLSQASLRLSNLSFKPLLEVKKAIVRQQTPENILIGTFALGGAILGIAPGNNPFLGAALGGATGLGVTQFFKRGGSIPLPQSFGRGGAGGGWNFPSFNRRGFGGGGSGTIGNIKKRSIIIILLVILLITLSVVFILGLFNPFQDTAQNSQLKIEKTSSKSVVANDEQIDYILKVINQGSSPISSEVSDTIPGGTEYVQDSATDNPTIDRDPSGKPLRLTWRIDGLGAGGIKQLSFSVQPQRQDFWVVNEAEGKITSLSQTGSSTTPSGSQTDPSSVAGVNDFNTLMKGQGRNTFVMGDENSFVAKAVANAPSLLTGKEDYLRIVYQRATALNVNPLAILVHWGTETGFRVDLQAKAFSCPVRVSSSFGEQAACSSKTFNTWMKVFEEKNTNGQYFDPKYPNCVYDDPFIFAAEMYGPTCRVYDGNENYLKNFVKFYKQILGAT